MTEPLREANDEREALEARWFELTREALPAIAAERGFPVRLDHCFQRILLDNACGTVWYDRIEKRPAYAHAPNTILRAAVELGERVLAGEAELWPLNDSSLAWRGKPMKGPGRMQAARLNG